MLTLDCAILDVATEQHLNLQNIPHAETFADLIRGIGGVTEVKLWPNSDDALYVTFPRNQLKPVVWAIQAELEKARLAYTTRGRCAPPKPSLKWDGYNSLPPDVRLGVEQRTDMIKRGYASLKSNVREVNIAAWQTGKMLHEQRQDLSHNKHGGFQGWYEAEIPESKDTVYRLIAIYETYPNEIPQTVELTANLSVLYEITRKSTPDAARAEVEDRLTQGQKLNGQETKAIIAEHKDIKAMMWIDPAVINAYVRGYIHSDRTPYVSFEHLQALSPLQSLKFADDVRLAKKPTFDKVTDTPTPQALFKRLSQGGLTVDDTRMVVNRMVAFLRPSANDLSAADFTEEDFASLNQADESDKSDYDLAPGEAPTGVEGYVYRNGGGEVLHKPTGEVLTLAQFEKLKREKSKALKSTRTNGKRKSGGGGGGSGGGKKSASAAHGDNMAKGMVAQIDRVQARTQADFLRDELKKLDESVLDLLAVKISNCRQDNADLRNPLTYIAEFIQA